MKMWAAIYPALKRWQDTRTVAAAVSKDDVTQLLGEVETIYRMRGVTENDKAQVYAALRTSCRYQLEHRRGDFYDAVQHLMR